ncbi:Uncharacterised protein [Mycobacteroides abscessus subsp. abscessus]|nr:Uncharacterised protein [Mycobacteroides abscessus subsp. abscessus]SIA59511.1 Uncharacterised protein [Mycobacteroides abscessus subsp. abscessus]
MVEFVISHGERCTGQYLIRDPAPLPVVSAVPHVERSHQGGDTESEAQPHVAPEHRGQHAHQRRDVDKVTAQLDGNEHAL